MENKINFIYNDVNSFKKFLDSLPKKDRAKLLETIAKVENNGLLQSQKMQWTKKIDNNLYEIRSKFSSNIQRAIYFHYENNEYVITHGFTKKTQKTPTNEISKAKHTRNDFLHRKSFRR